MNLIQLKHRYPCQFCSTQWFKSVDKKAKFTLNYCLSIIQASVDLAKWLALISVELAELDALLLALPTQVS